jgi:Protein of unknown function (DUF3306)
MSAAEKSLQKFLQRWSRRKLATVERGQQASEWQAEQGESADPNTLANAPLDNSAAAAFDSASLPPIESINAATDIRAFLAPGVPIELTRAALRRAWVSDPTIRDFVGLAENQWDFTKPDEVPGFGSLELTPELRRLLMGFCGEKSADDARNTSADTAVEASENSGKMQPPDPGTTLLPRLAAVSPIIAPSQVIPQSVADQVVPQSVADNGGGQGQFDGAQPKPVPTRRKHGRALPE